MLAETWFTILTDPNHIIAEVIISIVMEIITFTLGYVFARKKIWNKIHDMFDKEHGVTHE